MRLGVFFVSTSDTFINRPLATLARWLDRAGIRSVLLQLPAHASTDAAHARVLIAHGVREVVLRTDGRDIRPETIGYELTRRHGSGDTFERVIRDHPDVSWWLEIGNEPDMDFGPGYGPVAPEQWRTMLVRAAEGTRDLVRSLGLKTIAALPTVAPQTRTVLVDGSIARLYDAVAVHVYGHERMGDNPPHTENLALVEADPSVKTVVLTEVGINGPGLSMVEKARRIRAWAEAYRGKAELALVFCTGTKDWKTYLLDSEDAFTALGIRGEHEMVELWYPDAIRIPATRYYDEGRRHGRRWPDTVDTIVEHHTVGNWDSAVDTLSGKTARRASAHFLVGRDGRVAQLVSLADIAWHAGNWNWNVRSVGIEHEHYQVGGRWTDWTDEQLEASARLHRWLMERMKTVTIKRHREVSDEPTSCPLDLPVEEIVRRARGEENMRMPADVVQLGPFGRHVGHGFLVFWRALEEVDPTLPLRVLGWPLTEEFEAQLPGQPQQYTYQVFERGVLTWRGGEPAPWDVHLCHLPEACAVRVWAEERGLLP